VKKRELVSNELFEASQELAAAEVMSQAYQDARSQRQSIQQRFEEQIRTRNEELREITSRLQRYTWNMYNRWVSMWTNDVALAERQRIEKLAEIEELERRLARYKDDIIASTQGEQAEINSRLRKAQIAENHTQALFAEADKEFNTTAMALRDAELDLAKKLEDKGVSSFVEMEMYRNMAMKVADDARHLATVEEGKTLDPFGNFRSDVKQLHEEMDDEDFLEGQGQLLATFAADVKNEFKVGAESDLGTLVYYLTKIDFVKFAALQTGKLQPPRAKSQGLFAIDELEKVSTIKGKDASQLIGK